MLLCSILSILLSCQKQGPIQFDTLQYLQTGVLRNVSPLPGLSGRFGKDGHERRIGVAQTQHSAWAVASSSSSSECSLHGCCSDAALTDGSGRDLCPEPQTVQAGTCARAPVRPGRKSVEAKETSKTSLTPITRSWTRRTTNRPVAGRLELRMEAPVPLVGEQYRRSSDGLAFGSAVSCASAAQTQDG
jgi:hypothetical protein